MELTLSDKINQLRHAISEIDGLSEEKRIQLLQSIDELDLGAPAGDDSHLPLLGQLEDSLIEVEARHPDAAQLLRNLGDALGRMGL
jgi:hypothetical protein